MFAKLFFFASKFFVLLLKGIQALPSLRRFPECCFLPVSPVSFPTTPSFYLILQQRRIICISQIFPVLPLSVPLHVAVLSIQNIFINSLCLSGKSLVIFSNPIQILSSSLSLPSIVQIHLHCVCLKLHHSYSVPLLLPCWSESFMDTAPKYFHLHILCLQQSLTQRKRLISIFRVKLNWVIFVEMTYLTLN